MPPDPQAQPAPAVAALPEPPQQSRRRGPAWPGWLLLAGAVVQLAPFVLLPFVLTQDGPAHVDGAWVLLHHGDPGRVGAALRTAFTVDLTPVPNMLDTLLLSGLMAVFSPDVAEKILLVLLVGLLVGGLRYALRGVDRRADWLAVAALPLAGSALVAYGFYNFCLGVALSLWALGLALRARSGWRPATGLALAGLLLLTWSAHLLPWLFAVGAAAALAVARSLADLRGGDPARAVVLRHVLPPVLAALPSAALTIAYAATHTGSRGGPVGAPSLLRLAQLVTLYSPLAVRADWQIVPVVVVAVVVGWLLVVALRSRERGGADGVEGEPRAVERRVLGGLVVLAAAACLLTPSRLGTDYGFLPQRLAWFPLLLAVLFCATRTPVSRRAQAVAAGLVVLAAGVAVVVRLPEQVRDTRLTNDVLAATDEIRPGSTFVVLRYRTDGGAWARPANGPDPLQHVAGRLAVRAGAIDAGLYEAVYPYFQVRFTAAGDLRTTLDPTLFGLEKVPPQVRLSRVRGRLDEIVLVGLDAAEVSAGRRTDPVLRELHDHYRPLPGDGLRADVSVWQPVPGR